MNRKLVIKYYSESIPFFILFLTVSLKWLFEGVFDQPLFELFFLTIGVFLLISKRGIRINKLSIMWLLFIFNIAISVLTHNSSFGIIGRAMIIIMIASYALFIDYDIYRYKGAIKFLIVLATFYGFFIILQFILRERFNDAYFSVLIEAYKSLAQDFYDKGYFFGLIFNSHEVAGLISFAIVALVLWQVVNERKNIMIIPVVLLAFPLLLTQKKGVITISVLVLVFTLLIQYGTKKQWKKVIGVLFVILLTYIVIRYFGLPDTNSILFYRFQQFFSNITNGDSFDSGRGSLYDIAISEWEENKLFGIGWRHFNGLTTTVYGYSLGHEVNRDYLQWLCETGIIGLILNLIPVIVTFYRTIVICRYHLRRVSDATTQWVVLFAVFVQIFILLYAWIEIPFYDIVWFSMYIFSCIVINSAYRRAKNGELFRKNIMPLC
ncbi:O-antigen ligase family protein [Desulfosporosinus nitroreducens]|uniref:O-antigen ligase family protein n=1 Tax=Desulfosporosinus nitroreducens TaxID=2018668 RepID=A0ABT8QUP3_9FIRM|nr:O-antigen ligase family protein [Desulfosporosinus nitroreducens]MDO0824279.1 O-antigen ligase family protein [Desulfosporosinus nitroreducens]